MTKEEFEKLSSDFDTAHSEYMSSKLEVDKQINELLEKIAAKRDKMLDLQARMRKESN